MPNLKRYSFKILSYNVITRLSPTKQALTFHFTSYGNDSPEMSRPTNLEKILFYPTYPDTIWTDLSNQHSVLLHLRTLLFTKEAKQSAQELCPFKVYPFF